MASVRLRHRAYGTCDCGKSDGIPDQDAFGSVPVHSVFEASMETRLPWLSDGARALALGGQVLSTPPRLGGWLVDAISRRGTGGSMARRLALPRRGSRPLRRDCIRANI